ncbi:MAG TPA: TraR/DksA C4-type zinc finger protein [Candidatus Eisenbacteria bacterium]|jgi:RNA polymerase-binding protein DksA|nr:TraR/DksA C4-type zinc finger protein [Candidatus Eisenbacteria bacterium]
MDKKDLKVFRELLLKKKAALAKGIEHIANDALKTSQREAAGDLSAYSLHMADMATDNYDREFALNLADNEQKVVHRIDAALEKLDANTFGLCEVCNKKISKVRLKAVPYAELCVPCQEKQEKKKR